MWVPEDFEYFHSLNTIIGVLVDFSRLKIYHHIIFAHLVPISWLKKEKNVGELIKKIKRSKQLVRDAIEELEATFKAGLLQKMVQNDSYLQSLVRSVEVYEDELMALRELIYPPTSEYRMLPIPARNISKKRKNVPLLDLSRLPFCSYDQVQDLPPLSS